MPPRGVVWRAVFVYPGEPMEELQRLVAEMQTQSAELGAAAAAMDAENAPPEAAERFAAAERTFNETRDRAQALKARLDSESVAVAERNRRGNAAASARDVTDSFVRSFVRNPNADPSRGDNGKRWQGTPGGMEAMLQAAFGAWTRAPYAPETIQQSDLDACARLGVAPTGPRFAPLFMTHERYETYLRNLSAAMGNTRYALEGYGGPQFFAATIAPAFNSPYLDSRVPDAAGYTDVPPTYFQNLERNIVSYGGVTNAPITIRTAAGFEDLEQDFADDQAEGYQIGEGRPITGAPVNPTFGKIIWKAWDYSSGGLIYTQRQLAVTRYSLSDFISEIQGERIGRVLAKKLTLGKGAAEPLGVWEAAVRGGKVAVTAANNALTDADFDKLEFALDPVFWNGPGVGWMMHPTTLQYMRGVKDLEGRPLWVLGMETTTNRMTFRNRPIFLNYAMPVMAPNAKGVVLFGDFSKYEMVRRGSGLPRLVRDDTTLRLEEKVIFVTLITLDAKLRDYGNCPLARLDMLA